MKNPNRIRKTAEDHVINTACVVFGVLLAHLQEEHAAVTAAKENQTL